MSFLRTFFTVILVSFATLLSGCAKSPETIVENFYRALANGEITEAKSYVSAQLVGMLGDGKLAASLSGETEKIRTCGGIKNIVVKLQGEGDVRFGTATVTYKDDKCKPKNEKTKLIKEDGNWKITASK